MPIERGRDLDVAEFIDARPVGSFQLRVLLLCAAVLFLDGYDTQAIGYVAPALTRQLGITRAALGPVFSSGLFGLMLGALALGPLADRFGRKRVIVISTIAFGACTLATMAAADRTSLLALRFLTGLGLGGAMPNAIALTAEFSPHRRRATMVMAMFCGFSLGAALGGAIAAAVIPRFGWPAVFCVGGVLPMVLAPVLIGLLPESVGFLALRQAASDQVRALLQRLSPGEPIADSARFSVREDRLAAASVASLFGEGRAAVTVLFWIVFFASLLDLYLVSNWLPTVLTDGGASISTAALISALFQVGGVAGAFALGAVIDRFSFRGLALTYLGAAIAVAGIGYSSHAAAPAAIVVFCAGFCIVGGQIAANALVANYYPTAIRSTGVGWALGVGRIGSIVGPLAGGILLSRRAGAELLFVSAAVPIAGACIAAFAIDRLTTVRGTRAS